MALLSRDFIMRHLDVEDNEQESIDFCIEWAQARAESIIGRKLDSDTYTWYIDGSGGDTIVLPVTPITEVTGVYLDSARAFETALDTDDYYTDTDTGIIQLYSRTTPKGARTVKVVATAGYTEDTLPADLKMAFISAISHHMVKLINRGFGINSQTSPDGVNMTYEMELPSDAKRIFDSYSDVRV